MCRCSELNLAGFACCKPRLGSAPSFGRAPERAIPEVLESHVERPDVLEGGIVGEKDDVAGH
jgi:hypothetical protein